MTEPPAVASPGTAVSSEFTGLASAERIAAAAAALQRNGVRPLLAATGADARGLVGSLLADGAEVYNNTSQTLEAIGVAGDIERSGRYQPLRLRLYRMDREMQRREMRTLAAAPDYVVGSVHALTEGGSLLIASASGSQLGPLVSGAGRVILVIGAQKIVSDVATGLRRIYEYCYPLEDARARRAYGVPSGVNNILIINTASSVSVMLAACQLGGSWGQRGQQGGRVVAAAVDDAVDEQGRRAHHLARSQAAVDIPADPVRHLDAGPVPVERRHVQAELGGVPAQVAVLERLLAVEQQLVHVPEPALPGGGLGCAGRGEGVRVDAGQREMPEREPHVPAQLAFDLLDRVERLTRVRALVIAVLDDQAAAG